MNYYLIPVKQFIKYKILGKNYMNKNDKNQLEIITTVYNRKECLIRLYKSLVQQDCTNFIWTIVDDGSAEKIEDMVNEWQKSCKFKIKLYIQRNMGKMSAYKKAIDFSKSKWSIVVDSDDVVLSNCVSTLLSRISEIEDNKMEIIGAVFPKGTRNLKNWRKISGKIIDIISLRYEYSIPEAVILVNNKMLRQEFVNLLIPNEKFMSEEVLYNRLAFYGKFIVYLDVFYTSEYQDDGLTVQIFNIWKDSPNGTLKLLTSRYCALGDLPIFFEILGKVKTILNLNAFCMAKDINYLAVTPNKYLSRVLYIPSRIVRAKRF